MEFHARRLVGFLFLLGFVGLGGCGDYSTEPPAVTTVVVSPADTVVEIGGTVDFTAAVLGEHGDSISVPFIAWSTAAPSIAAVTEGTVYGHDRGETRVVASVAAIRGEARVRVVAPVPASPSELSALRTTDAVQLDWQVNSRFGTSMEVQRRAGPAEFVVLETLEGSPSRHLDPTVGSDLTYGYRVRACNESGCSSFSTEAEVVMPPTAPDEVVVTASSTTELTVTWADRSTTESEFVLERRLVDGSFSEVARPAADEERYIDQGLTADTGYRYRVRACSPAGCSEFSEEAGGRTAAPAIPVAPSEAVAWLVDSLRVVVSWRDNSAEETLFRIERAAEEGFELAGTVSAGTTTYSDAQLELDSRYRYRVQACNVSGCSPYSNEGVMATRPYPPDDLAATSTSETTIDLAWLDTSASETEFRVERRQGSGPFVEVATTDANTELFADTGLVRGQEYGYRLRACNEGGCSAYSTEAAAVTPITTPPLAPSSLIAFVEQTPRIVLLWTDNSTTEERFEVERRVESGEFAPYATTGADVERYADTEVQLETQYGYRVRACGAAGCSAYTIEVRPRTPPFSPTDLSATAVSSSTVELTWTDHSSVESYVRVERSTATGSFVPTASWILAADTESYVDNAVSAETTYRYRVRVCADYACSAFSTEATATTPAP